jgi:OOP family OmpA-OmpF porin
MKNQWKIYSFTLGVILLTGATAANAEEIQNGVYVAPSLGYYFFDGDNNNNADDTFFYGLSVGYQFNKKFAVEASYFELEPEVKDPGFDIDGHYHNASEDIDTQHYRLDGIFNFDLPVSSIPVSPYLSIGYGKLETDLKFSDEDDWMMDVGVGIKQKITPAFSLRGDVRAFHSWDNDDTDYGLSVGLVYLFGAKQTPTTPPEAKVEQPTQQPTDNCASDTDGDSVPDCRDQCPGSDPRAEIDEKGCYRTEQVIDRVELNILFDSNKAVVKSEYYSEIQKVADFMQKHPDTKADIEGHTDNVGSNQYNQRLSQRRADAVRQVLISKFNIAPLRLRAMGYGETRPVQSNATATGRQANRRVIAVLQTTVEGMKKK